MRLHGGETLNPVIWALMIGFKRVDGELPNRLGYGGL
jgi:hypothetical protein